MLSLLIILSAFLALSLGFTVGVLYFGFGQRKIEKEAVEDGFIELDGVYYRLTRIGLWDANKDDVWKKVWGDERYYD